MSGKIQRKFDKDDTSLIKIEVGIRVFFNYEYYGFYMFYYSDS